MSKELTPLECVEYIRKQANGNWLDDELDIIETALKRLEENDNRSSMKMENILPHIFDDNEQLKKRLDDTQTLLWEKNKKLKALEIIKSKEMLSVFKGIDGKYFISFNTIAIEIPQTEYDLLKEVLLWI